MLDIISLFYINKLVKKYARYIYIYKINYKTLLVSFL